jgi:AcrR family transcriptional regulator
MPRALAKDERRPIPTPVKNDALVQRKRADLVASAVPLFIRKGYHQTTTREIAAAVGWSIGSLYEYVKSKEDILYLVCDAIHSEMEAALRSDLREDGPARATLEAAVASYITTCDRMQDSILLIYKETSSLPQPARRYVLENESRITAIFQEILERGRVDGSLHLDSAKSAALMAHNIVVLGHMWAFRRWALAKSYKLRDYIQMQTSLILSEMGANDR